MVSNFNYSHTKVGQSDQQVGIRFPSNEEQTGVLAGIWPHRKPFRSRPANQQVQVQLTLFTVGPDVQNEKAFVRSPGMKPFFVADPDELVLHCPESNRIYADRVDQNVPIFKSEFTLPVEVLIADLAPGPIHPKRAEAATPDAPSGMILPFTGGDYVAARSKRIYVTQRRIDVIGPSVGCEACRSGTYAILRSP